MKAYFIIIRIRQLLTIAIFTALFSLVLCSCEQHELCYNHNHMGVLDLKYDWSQAPYAKPQSMFLYLFPTDSTRTLKRDLVGYEGARLELEPKKEFSILSFNSDFNNDVVSDNGGREDIIISTKPATYVDKVGFQVSSLPLVRGTEDSEIKCETDSIWSATSENNVYLSLEKAYNNEDYQLTLSPKRLHATYHITIKKVKNPIKIASGIAATLSGINGSVKASTGEKVGDNVIITFPMLLNEANGALEGSMNCFGYCEKGEVPNKLMVYTILKDGSKWSYVYDVTDQIHHAEDPYNVHIVLDELPVPDVIGDNSGFSPGVDDWNVIDIPVKM